MRKTMLVLAVLAMAAMIAAPAMAVTGDLYENFSDWGSDANLYGTWSGGGTNNGETYWDLGNDTDAIKMIGGELRIAGGAGDVSTGTSYAGGRTGLIYIDLDVKGLPVAGGTTWGLKVDSAGGQLMGRWYGAQDWAKGRNDWVGVTTQASLDSNWAHLGMIIDTNANTIDYLFNGVSLGVINYTASGAAGQAIGNIWFQRHGNTGAVGENTYFDNLRIASSPMPPVVTPEPGSILALGSGLIGMAGFAIRRRRA